MHIRRVSTVAVERADLGGLLTDMNLVNNVIQYLLMTVGIVMGAIKGGGRP